MIKLFRNYLFILFLGLAACSSNTNVGQDDLSISEIEDIEKTGEFSEEDFFKDEEILKESGVKVDIEGLDDSNLQSQDTGLVSDLDVQDFEGESFDSNDDFETDLGGGDSVAEFDEFDEFVTTDKVAKNEEIVKNPQPSVGDIATQPTMTEEDIFSEFEESTDVAAQPGQTDSAISEDLFGEIEETPVVADATTQPDLEFEDVFNETSDATTADTQIADTTPTVDTTLDTDVDASQFQDPGMFEETPVATNNSDFDTDFGPGPTPTDIPPPKSDSRATENIADSRTAKEILSQQQYEKPEQLATTITRKVQSWIPVKKMKDEPFDQNGILMNALYIVREGDTFKTIGEKIYGKGSVNNLAKVNPFLNPKRLKVGEKVYYNSPNRPNDSNTMLFYYDDIGRSPQYRQVNAGENIRTISQELLEHPRSWMEIWATNPEVVSKFELERSHRIKYFAKNNVQSMVQDTQTMEAENIPDMDETEPSVATNLNDDPNAMPTELPEFDDQAANPAETDPNAAIPTEPNFDEGFDDQAATGTTENAEPNFDEGFDDQAAVPSEPVDGIGSIPEQLNNQNQFKEAGGLQKLLGMDQKMIETVGMGLAGLVLIIVILVIARRRRMYAQATEVQEFDFAGSTKIDEQTKTHIDM